MRRLAAAMLPLLLGALQAQEMRFQYPSSSEPLVGVSMVPYVASGANRGGFGFLAVDAQNLDAAPHRLTLEYRSSEWQEHDVRGWRTVDLGPGERARFFLPIPCVGSNVPVLATIDGQTHWQSVNSAGREHTALLIGDRPQLQPPLLAVAQAVWPGASSGGGVEVATASARDVPADWRLYTGFDLLVVDGLSAAEPPLQEALRRFAFGGGRVVVIGPDRLPAGALRAALEPAADEATVAVGLGALVKVPLAFQGDRLASELGKALRHGGGFPLSAALGVPQEIPGLASAPVVLFLLVILVFAIAVGPVNLLWLKRTRRPLLALLTVPALGFGTTFIMIGFAVVRDGFGVRGVSRSWTVLDQAAHEAVNVNTRTLFAGLTPGELPLGDDAMLIAPRAFYRPDRSMRDHWHFTAETGMVAGGVLPSRTQTALVSVRQGTARARLAASVRPDGDLDLRTDGGVQPVGTVLVRGFGGEYWAGEGTRLRRCTATEAASHLRAAVATAERWSEPTGRRNAYEYGREDEAFQADIDPLGPLLASGLRPGSYVAMVAGGDWIPEFGLGVAYESTRHHVLGYLAPEDLIR